MLNIIKYYRYFIVQSIFNPFHAYTMVEPIIALHAQTNNVGIPQLIVASKCRDLFILCSNTMVEPIIALHAQTNNVGIPQLIVASKCRDLFILCSNTMVEPIIALHAQTNNVGIPQLMVASKCREYSYYATWFWGKIGVVVRSTTQADQFDINLYMCMLPL
jgi:hypothetical protein